MGERTSRPVGFATAFAAGALLLLASLANFLAHTDYPFFRVDVAIVVGAIVCLTATVAFLYAGQRQWGRSFLDGLLAAIFIDLNTPWPVAPVAVGVAVAIIGWRARISLAGPMAVFAFFILVTVAVGLSNSGGWIRETKSPGSTPAPPSNKSAVLHLILDEHLGVEGFREADPDSQLLKHELRSTYAKAGFVVYGGAYSSHAHTINAIPYILSYGRHRGLPKIGDGVDAGHSDYLEDLTHKGFRLTVLQSDYADLCTDNSTFRCITYDSSSLRPTLSVPLDTFDRAKLIAWKFLALSHLFRAATLKVGELGILAGFDGEALVLQVDSAPRTSTVASLDALEFLSNELGQATPGDAFVAHLLAPHHPYLVDSNCKYLPRADWGYLQVPKSTETRRRLYRGQVRCTTKRVLRAIEAFDRSKAGKNAIVIIHGDHGSRISAIAANEQNYGRFGDEDLIAWFSTFFAVRIPNLDPSYVADRQPASSLLKALADSDFKAPPPADQANVNGLFLDDPYIVVTRRIPMPRSWQGPSQSGTAVLPPMTPGSSSDKKAGGER